MKTSIEQAYILIACAFCIFDSYCHSLLLKDDHVKEEMMMIGKESNHKPILKGNKGKMTLQHTFHSEHYFFALLCKEIVWHMNVDKVIYIFIYFSGKKLKTLLFIYNEYKLKRTFDLNDFIVLFQIFSINREIYA